MPTIPPAEVRALSSSVSVLPSGAAGAILSGGQKLFSNAGFGFGDKELRGWIAVGIFGVIAHKSDHASVR